MESWTSIEYRVSVSHGNSIWVFPKIGLPQNGLFIMENPIKMDDLGVPLFLETSIWFHFKGEYFSQSSQSDGRSFILVFSGRNFCWWFRNPANQLRLVVYPTIYKGFIHPRWYRISSINSCTQKYHCNLYNPLWSMGKFPRLCGTYFSRPTISSHIDHSIHQNNPTQTLISTRFQGKMFFFTQKTGFF